jgi:hypothetical protein
LPVIDAVSGDYRDDIEFIAVAGRSDFDASAERVGVWFSPDNLSWGYDDDLWGLYGIPGQPSSVLITQGVIVAGWFGAIPEDEFRAQLDNLIELST